MNSLTLLTQDACEGEINLYGSPLLHKAKQLHQHGLLQLNGARAGFISPLHAQYYLVQHYQTHLQSIEDCSNDFYTFWSTPSSE